jgi:hypothetical protein
MASQVDPEGKRAATAASDEHVGGFDLIYDNGYVEVDPSDGCWSSYLGSQLPEQSPDSAGATRNDNHRVKNAGHSRAINRHQWDYPSLEALLSDPDSSESQIFSSLKKLIEIRRQQPAFHPNATQFTLHLGSKMFGFWRQSIDRQQSIFCVSNISDSVQRLNLSDLNLIDNDNWTDLISQLSCNDKMQTIDMQPYQTVWITNEIIA